MRMTAADAYGNALLRSAPLAYYSDDWCGICLNPANPRRRTHEIRQAAHMAAASARFSLYVIRRERDEFPFARQWENRLVERICPFANSVSACRFNEWLEFTQFACTEQLNNWGVCLQRAARAKGLAKTPGCMHLNDARISSSTRSAEPLWSSLLLPRQQKGTSKWCERARCHCHATHVSFSNWRLLYVCANNFAVHVTLIGNSSPNHALNSHYNLFQTNYYPKLECLAIFKEGI